MNILTIVDVLLPHILQFVSDLMDREQYTEEQRTAVHQRIRERLDGIIATADRQMGQG